MSVIKSRMGKDMIAIDGYIFRKNNSNKATQNWRCAFTKCNATLVTNLNYLESLQLKEGNPHNHPPNPAKKLRCDALRRLDDAARSSDASPRALITKLYQTLDDEVVAVLPDIRALSKRVHRKRKELLLRSSIAPIEIKEEHKDSTSADDASQEKSDPSDTGPLICSYCGEHFSQRHSLLKHERLNHWSQGRRCRKCNREFRSGYIVQHMKMCKGRPHRCLACGEYFHSLRSLSRHKIVYHSYKKQSDPSQLVLPLPAETESSQQDDAVNLKSFDLSWGNSSLADSDRLPLLPSSSADESGSSQLVPSERVSMPSLISFSNHTAKTLGTVADTSVACYPSSLVPSNRIAEYCEETSEEKIPAELKDQMTEDVYGVLQENWKSIRTQSILACEMMDWYNFRLSNNSVDEVKEAVKAKLSCKHSPFKVNLAFGYLVRESTSGIAHYSPASLNTKAVFDQPRVVSNTEELDRFLSSLVLILIAEKAAKRCPSPDVVVEAVTNLEIYVYYSCDSFNSERFQKCKSISGIPDSTTSDEKPLFSDVTSVFRCIAQKLGCQSNSLDCRTGELYWKYASFVGEHLPNGVPLNNFGILEELFGLQITVFQSDSNGLLKMLRRGKSGGDTLHLHLVGNCYHFIPDASE